jgi:hypothetical protein
VRVSPTDSVSGSARIGPLTGGGDTGMPLQTAHPRQKLLPGDQSAVEGTVGGDHARLEPVCRRGAHDGQGRRNAQHARPAEPTEAGEPRVSAVDGEIVALAGRGAGASARADQRRFDPPERQVEQRHGGVVARQQPAVEGAEHRLHPESVPLLGCARLLPAGLQHVGARREPAHLPAADQTGEGVGVDAGASGVVGAEAPSEHPGQGHERVGHAANPGADTLGGSQGGRQACERCDCAGLPVDDGPPAAPGARGVPAPCRHDGARPGKTGRAPRRPGLRRPWSP